jgi:type II secretory pathway pseudopilin PulG
MLRAEKTTMPILTAGKTGNKGYAYLMLLVVAASMAIAASSAGIIVYSRAVRIEKESELIFRGQAYQAALRSYYESSTGKKTYPQSLAYLLSDPRFPDKKHIRKLYKDPITGGEWKLYTASDNGITGVASASFQKPLKQKGFPEELKHLEEAKHYSDWVFMAK